MARRAHVVVDADAYFKLIREAMEDARQRIFLIGWDFDSRILLSDGRRWWQRGRKRRFPARLGSFIAWLVDHHAPLEVLLLKWNFSLFKSLFRGTMLVDLVRWAWRDRIDFKFDAAHPIGCSHHQKIVVIDDVFAVCGGIDMTSDRWDTPAHLPRDTRRRKPTGGLYGPWHDITMMLEGEAAAALGDLGRERWEVAGGRAIAPCAPQETSPWPERLKAEFADVELGIARTRAAYGDCPQVSEIEALFVEQIARAKRFIYAETQYFASRVIAEAICERLLEDDPPEIVIINPLSADGWLEQIAMDTARVNLLEVVEAADHAGRFHIYHPLAADDTPIYVHAKLTIVDDAIVRIGSANMNNRSMGLDSECDVFIDTARPVNAGRPELTQTIENLRIRLLGEHCGLSEDDVRERLGRHGSMAAMIEARLTEKGHHGKRLERLPLKHLSDAERAIGASAVLDPERPGEMFEPIERRGLFRRKGALVRVRLMERWKRRMRV
ncbi:phospholipase D-like domain-containing protein [Novosphingobium sp. 1949]|uniref:Phospholipase D n=2 Tax=Novosphingobium organovorum TaxID=2930092 RepID=A0ABT0BDJ4_9SPHN|nr:phospholipase D-like domain-containing protein [Novosphingobium organovorum]MCJ2183053.1 phospholipase D-like domain-containing protein [Novosphingobium organovorum]